MVSVLRLIRCLLCKGNLAEDNTEVLEFIPFFAGRTERIGHHTNLFIIAKKLSRISLFLFFHDGARAMGGATENGGEG